MLTLASVSMLERGSLKFIKKWIMVSVQSPPSCPFNSESVTETLYL